MTSHLISVTEALKRILQHFPPLDVEEVPLEQADGRVFADEIRSPLDIPSVIWSRFSRSVISALSAFSAVNKYKVLAGVTALSAGAFAQVLMLD